MSSIALGANAESRARYEFLDFVRGIAALAVVLQHCGGHLWPELNEFRRVWFDLGNFGVVVFFLTSGFIIPESLERGGSAGRFWVGRFFRLFPLYWLSLALALAFHLGGYAPGHEFEAAFRSNIGRNALVNITMLQQFVGVPHAIQPYWTLSVELLFYGACTALFVVGARNSVRTAYLVAVLGFLLGVVLPLLLGRRMPMGTIFFLMSMFAGTVLFKYQAGDVSKARCAGVFAVVAVVGAIGVIVDFWVRRGLSSAINTPSSFLLTWLAAYLFFACAFASRNRAYPRALLWLGAVSYSLYLIHHSVLYMGFPELHRTLPRPVALVVILSASLAAAVVTYHLVERPGIRLGRAVQRRLFEGSGLRAAHDEPAERGLASHQRIRPLTVSHTR